MSRIYLCLFRFCQLLSCCLLPYFSDYVLSFLTGKKWKMQTMCGIIIQVCTGKKFESERPSWLKNPLTGRCMEIDYYNHKLSLGIEYNGKQHYEYTPHFHKEKFCAYDGKVVPGMRHFELQVFRDEAKKSLCDKYGVTLLIVPYTIPAENLTSYILEKLSRIPSMQKFLSIKIDESSCS